MKASLSQLGLSPADFGADPDDYYPSFIGHCLHCGGFLSERPTVDCQERKIVYNDGFPHPETGEWIEGEDHVFTDYTDPTWTCRKCGQVLQWEDVHV